MGEGRYHIPVNEELEVTVELVDEAGESIRYSAKAGEGLGGKGEVEQVSFIKAKL